MDIKEVLPYLVGFGFISFMVYAFIKDHYDNKKLENTYREFRKLNKELREQSKSLNQVTKNK